MDHAAVADVGISSSRMKPPLSVIGRQSNGRACETVCSVPAVAPLLTLGNENNKGAAEAGVTSS